MKQERDKLFLTNSAMVVTPSFL